MGGLPLYRYFFLDLLLPECRELFELFLLLAEERREEELWLLRTSVLLLWLC